MSMIKSKADKATFIAYAVMLVIAVGLLFGFLYKDVMIFLGS